MTYTLTASHQYQTVQVGRIQHPQGTRSQEREGKKERKKRKKRKKRRKKCRYIKLFPSTSSSMPAITIYRLKHSQPPPTPPPLCLRPTPRWKQTKNSLNPALGIPRIAHVGARDFGLPQAHPASTATTHDTTHTSTTTATHAPPHHYHHHPYPHPWNPWIESPPMVRAASAWTVHPSCRRRAARRAPRAWTAASARWRASRAAGAPWTGRGRAGLSGIRGCSWDGGGDASWPGLRRPDLRRPGGCGCGGVATTSPRACARAGGGAPPRPRGSPRSGRSGRRPHPGPARGR